MAEDQIDVMSCRRSSEPSIACIRYFRLRVSFVGPSFKPQKNLVETMYEPRRHLCFFRTLPMIVSIGLAYTGVIEKVHPGSVRAMHSRAIVSQHFHR
jgi:hypothetical protein